jgi:phage/plasmid-like protein (TIGR03299 family)
MSHNITSDANLFVVKEKAWHGLGTVVEKAQTSEQAIKLAGLDFIVEKTPIFMKDADTKLIEVPNKFCTYRTDSRIPFGVVGSAYHCVQNTEAFNFFDVIVGKGEAIYETAGCLFDGQITFISAKLPNHIKVGKNDLIEQYLFITNAHDGTAAIKAAFTPVRIVCNNTLNAALKDCSNKISIRHTKSASDRLREAHKLMGISNLLAKELEKAFNQMAKIKVTDKRLLNYIHMIMAPNKEALEALQAKQEVSNSLQKKVDECYEYAMASPSQNTPTTKGTAFGAYNAITGYLQNVKHYRCEDDKVRSLLYGSSDRIQNKAFDLALKLN